MKFTLPSVSLSEAIAAAISSLPSKPTAPILGGVLIQALVGAVAFSSFNYDRATTRTVLADITDADTVVVSGRLLAAIGRNLPKTGETTVMAEGSALLITSGRTTYRLPLMHAADYPQLPDMSTAPVVGAVDCEEFADAVKIFGSFASTEPQPPNLTFLNITCQPEALWLCATDRYVIGRRRLKWSGDEATTIINVAASDMLSTIRAVVDASATKDVEMLWDGSMLGLRTPATTVVTRGMDGQFPNLANVLKPITYSSTATVQTSELLSMLKRAGSVADDLPAQVDIKLDADALSVTTTKSAWGNISDSIEAKQTGPQRAITLSSRRLYNALTAAVGAEITLAFQQKGHLITIYPGDTDLSAETDPMHCENLAMLMGIGTK